MTRWAVAIVAAMLAGACAGGGASGDDPTTTPSAPDPGRASPTASDVAAVAADLVAISAGVEVRTDERFEDVPERAQVSAGDAVKTDGSGFAEIAYSDRSFTRLDVSTELEVLELGDAVARSELAAGRIWNRIDGQSEQTFTVDTAVATATAEGTAFAIDCRAADTCSFTVVEGVLELTLPNGEKSKVDAPTAVTVDGDGISAPVLVGFDSTFGDQWLRENAKRDAAAGLPDAAEIYEALGPAFSSLNGPFDVLRTFRSCTGPCAGAPPPGDVSERHYEFGVDCSGGFPCAPTVSVEYDPPGEEVSATATVPLAFDGKRYTWKVTAPTVAACSDGTGELKLTISSEMRATSGEIRRGAWVTTAIEGASSSVNVSKGGTCGDSRSVVKATFEGTR